MPKRTNEYQELVALIERALSGKGAKVTQSAEVKVDGLETLREIDVLIEDNVGTYQVRIAVEARDTKRKVDLSAFDKFLGQYRGECRVLVDKHVLVARAGFTKGVIEKAAKTDVELLTLAEAKGKDWSKVAPGTATFKAPPHVCGVRFVPPINTSSPKDLLNRGRFICRHGHDHGTVKQRAEHVVFRHIFPTIPDQVRDVERQVQESPTGNGFVQFPVEAPGATIALDDKRYSIEKMEVSVHFVSARGVATHHVYERSSSRGGKHLLHHLQAIAGGKRLDVLIPGGSRKPERIVVKIDNDPANMNASQKRARRKERRKKRAP